MPSERREDLFEAFASSRNDGTGLGLHLAHLIAEAHGAELSYRDPAPQGSCFVLAGLKQTACDEDAGN